MSRLVTILGTVLLLGILTFISQGSSSPATAGFTIPPPGNDIYDVNGKVDIDINLCCETSEAVNLTGSMEIERGAMSKEGIIDIEIISMSLTGMSSLLGANTPVTVSLNPNAGEPALGQIIPVKNAAYFSIPFMDVQIGENFHYLTQPLDLSATINGIPFPGGDKFTSDFKEGGHPIQDNEVSGTGGIRGFLTRLNIDIKPPDKTYTITVLKQHADTKASLPGWEMNLYADSNCIGNPIDSATTDSEGIADFVGLAPGGYSVEEKMQAGWNNITPLCQDTSVPTTAGASVSGLPACPIQPDEPFPAPGCDEFNSVASVNIEFFNPPGAQLHCALGGPTQITRSAVNAGALDNIQTEITVLDLSGTCDPGGVVVTVRLNPDIPSTGKITEQQNGESGVLEFKANSYFDIYFEVDTPLGKLHNQDALRLECKIQDIPPYGCFYEPDVGTVTLYDDDKKEVATLIHAAHIPLDPKQKLLIFTNEPKPPTTPTPVDVTPTPTGDTPTPTPTLNPTFQEKIEIPLVFYQLNGSSWNADTIKAMLSGANVIWAPANINFTWPNQPTLHPLADPATTQGEKGDVFDDTETSQVCDLARAARDTGKPGSFPIALVGELDGVPGETWGVAITKSGTVESGRCLLLSDDIKGDPHPKLGETLAHEMGHAMCLDHVDTDTAEMLTDADDTNNLLHATQKPTGNKLTKPQMTAARECAQALLAQIQTTPQPTPTQFPSTITPTATPTPGGDGDANKDGMVNSIDAAIVLQFVAGLIGPITNSDTNGDGTVNAIDAALILQFTAGLVPGLPI